MFKRIVVGVDGGPGGRDAAALARLLSDAHSHVTLVHIYLDLPVPWRGASLEYDALEREEAQHKLESTRAAVGLSADARCRCSSTVGRGLHEAAERENADLLIVGSSHRGLLGRVLVGERTRAALDGAPCAVAIAPTGFSERSAHLSEIGVAYDRSPQARVALETARALAAERSARLSAFMAVEFPAYADDGHTIVDEDTVADMIAQARQDIEDLGGVEPHAAYGRPAEELALYGASVDLLVVGSRGYGPVKRLIHGSTSVELTRRARCPLLIIPRAHELASMPTEVHHERVGA